MLPLLVGSPDRQPIADDLLDCQEVGGSCQSLKTRQMIEVMQADLPPIPVLLATADRSLLNWYRGRPIARDANTVLWPGPREGEPVGPRVNLGQGAAARGAQAPGEYRWKQQLSTHDAVGRQPCILPLAHHL